MWTNRDRRVADARLVSFVGGSCSGLRDLPRPRGKPVVAGVSGGVFVALALSHEPIRRAGDRARRAVDFYSKGLARLEGRWAGQGVRGLEYLDLEHPYAADLDLFGDGSLFERLCTARTRAGEEALASWLLAPATPETIRQRHQAVTELRPQLDLREDLELLGVEVRGGIDPAALAAWGTATRVSRQDGLRRGDDPGSARHRRGLSAGSSWTPGSCRSWLSWWSMPCSPHCLRPRPSRAGRRRSADARPGLALGAAAPAGTRDIPVASLEATGEITRDRWTGRLGPDPPAGPAAHLLDYQRNQLFMPLAFLWLWTIQLALRIDAWRAGSGRESATG